jgi:hypothetical protein
MSVRPWEAAAAEAMAKEVMVAAKAAAAAAATTHQIAMNADSGASSDAAEGDVQQAKFLWKRLVRAR